MTEIEKIDLFKKIEDGIVEHKLNLKDACERINSHSSSRAQEKSEV
jgi:hypothetical protein